MQVELVVFDLAGTTVKDNREVHKTLQYAMKKHGIEISLEDANSVMGIPKPIAIKKLLQTCYSGERIISDQWVETIHQYFVKNMIEFYLNDVSVKENDGVSDTFARLRARGVHVYLDTGFDRDIAAPLVARLGWKEKGLISGLLTSDGDMRGRPYPDMILRAMKLSGVAFASHVAKVGDTPADMQQGHSAGCGWVIGITTGASSEVQLLSEYHTHLIKQIPEILPILGVGVNAAITA
jgi:phosphonatase-like hydrolase